MMKFTVINEEVLYTTEALTCVDGRDVELLKSMAGENSRRRIRLCAHPDILDSLHEMIIVHSRGAYARPHKHIGKSESFHIMEGCLKVVIFADDGALRNVLTMDSGGCGGTLFFRLSGGVYHTIVPQSSQVVFHETTNGPFVRADTLYADWAPDDKDHDAARDYMEHLSSRISLFEEGLAQRK